LVVLKSSVLHFHVEFFQKIIFLCEGADLTTNPQPGGPGFEACNCITYIALCGIIRVIHKLEKMLKEVVAYFKVLSQEFSWKG
jgi:hypothetical protein